MYACMYACDLQTSVQTHEFTIHYVGVVYFSTLHALQTDVEGQPLPSPWSCMVYVRSSKAT